MALLFVLLLAGCETDTVLRAEPVSGSSIIISKDGKRLFTANGDAHTVSIVDTGTRKVIKEIQVGKKPQQLALSPDEKMLYVTSKYTNTVEVVDLKRNEIASSIRVGIEPYGVVTSPDGGALYVTSDRSATVSVIDTKSGNVTDIVKTAERPRAVSLSADGKRLMVAHYLSGQISVMDTDSKKVSGTIQLAKSPDKENRKKSQGIPNTLEQIRIAPDGSTAWVTHLLTNVDTPVNFEETIFPAVSVLDLNKGEESLKDRKELFEAINVKDSSNETMIVANPSDVLFSKDGAKVYVLMAGSEDLAVFDLKRGGKASQMLRHVPGDFPVAMVLSPDGDKLYVHNAMSHDLAVIDTGVGETYGEAKAEPKTIPLIGKDPLPPQVRKGKTIFYSANSDEYPVTKKNWMSCISCHAGGEINGLTIQTAKGPRNIPSNVLAMETGLFMWDGSRDDFSDYIMTIQGEMGGLEGIDPGKPMPKEAQQLLDDLQAFMEYPGAFPVPESPYRQTDGSLTEEAQEGKALFKGKANCISCHDTGVLTDSAKAVDAAGKLTTDNTSHLYDVGTGTEADKGSAGDPRAKFHNSRKPGQYDVPTLRGVWATAPYLHDGSAATLRDVLVARNAMGKHGSVSSLTDQEVDQLIAYLKSIK